MGKRGEISVCAGRGIRRSECGRKNRPAPFEMTGSACGSTPVGAVAGAGKDGALKGRRYTEAKRDFIPQNARDGAEVSLRRSTHSREGMRKNRPAPFEMTGVGMRIDASGGGCGRGRGERCRPKGTPLSEERSGGEGGAGRRATSKMWA